MKKIVILMPLFLLACKSPSKKAEEIAEKYIVDNYAKSNNVLDCTEPSTYFRKGILEKERLINSVEKIRLDYLESGISESEMINYVEALKKANASEGFYDITKCVGNTKYYIIVSKDFKVLNH